MYYVIIICCVINGRELGLVYCVTLDLVSNTEAGNCYSRENEGKIHYNHGYNMGIARNNPTTMSKLCQSHEDRSRSEAGHFILLLFQRPLSFSNRKLCTKFEVSSSSSFEATFDRIAKILGVTWPRPRPLWGKFCIFLFRFAKICVTNVWQIWSVYVHYLLFYGHYNVKPR